MYGGQTHGVAAG
ncbi:hypothetical protein YPPY08_1871, partial [Yersinia pestis PY-08]